MGFGGSVAAMMQSMKTNRAQLKKRDRYFDKEVNHEKAYGDFTDHKKMSAAQFENFKAKLKQQEKERSRKLLIIFSVVMIVIIGMLSYILFV